MGRAEMVYRPTSLLRPLYVTWVAWLVATISTFGNALPTLLMTVPVKLANWDWARRGMPSSITNDTTSVVRNDCVLIESPPGRQLGVAVPDWSFVKRTTEVGTGVK